MNPCVSVENEIAHWSHGKMVRGHFVCVDSVLCVTSGHALAQRFKDFSFLFRTGHLLNWLLMPLGFQEDETVSLN